MSQEARVPVLHFCPMCRFEAPTKPLLLNHLRLVHANDPRFSVPCGIGGCTYSAKSFSAFYSHIYRLHKDSGYIERRSSSSQQTSNTVPPQLSEGSQQGNSDHDVRWNAEVTGILYNCWEFIATVVPWQPYIHVCLASYTTVWAVIVLISAFQNFKKTTDWLRCCGTHTSLMKVRTFWYIPKLHLIYFSYIVRFCESRTGTSWER